MARAKQTATPPGRSRQAAAGEVTRRATRERVLRAAAAEFAERGYVGATVARIAERADVAVPTLYSAWGSKRALLHAVMLMEVTGDETGYPGDPTVTVLGLATDDDPVDAVDGGDAARYLGRLARGYRHIAERSAVGWTTYRDAAGVDADVAADWQELQLDRRETFRRLLASLPLDQLRPGLTRDEAVDTAWAIASPETHELFVTRLGWSYDRYQAWVASTLAAALAPSTPA